MFVIVYYINNNLENNIYSLIFEIIIGAIVYISLCITYLIRNEKELLNNILPQKYRTKFLKIEKEI